MSYVFHDKKNKRHRFYFMVNSKRKHLFDMSDAITKGTYRDFEALCEDLEQSNEAGTNVSEASWEILKGFRETNEKVYTKLLNAGYFTPRDNRTLTLAEAFDKYIKRQHHWRRRTIENWTQTKRKLIEGFPLDNPEKPDQEKELEGLGADALVKNITLEQMEEYFGRDGLRKHYSPATLEKDCKNLRAVWKTLHQRGDIEKNVLESLTFKLSDQYDRVADKDYVDPQWFAEALEAIPAEFIEQKTYLAYCRWMGARQSDPKGDKWEDVDLESSIATVIRWDGKKRQKIGICPIEQQRFPLRQMLAAYKAHVIREHGKATGKLFPWLETVSNSRIARFFKLRMERAGVEVWKSFFNSLRASRVVEIRQLPNGRKLEEMIIGHSAKIADMAYHPKARLEENHDVVKKLFFKSFSSDDKSNEGEAA